MRRELSLRIPLKRKSALGQFMTPSTVARFMASLFPPSKLQDCRLLDAGCGVGALCGAFLERWAEGQDFEFQRVEVGAYEIDVTFRAYLEKNFASYTEKSAVDFQIFSGDFIAAAAIQFFQGSRPFSHAILNPPYKKISSSSEHRLILRRVGIETVNLYSAFVALALLLLEPGGQLVAIIPRSFCNGPYYRPFRDFLFQHAAVRHIHLFASRSNAFKDDEVLQENVIIRLERGGVQGLVCITNSQDDGFGDLATDEHPFERIVFPDDPERFIHVPTSLEKGVLELSPAIHFSLEEIGVAISTGPVVDFRLQEYIREEPTEGSVPLLYPGHFSGSSTEWPKPGIKRGNAILLNDATRRWLYPAGFYTVTRRFSSKEERRRIIASVVDPNSFKNAEMLGFENHLNVFHNKKSGLTADLAHGLAAFLNTTAVDAQFRRFNGHTQVNATDLRLMRYPSRTALTALGKWARLQSDLTQDMLDDQFKSFS